MSKQLLRKYIFVLVVFSIIIFGNGFKEESYAQTPVNGYLQQVGNQKVLHLWGSNYEMGYAHGYLMADKIRDLIDTYLIGVICDGSVSNYNNRLTLIPVYQIFFPQYLDEINGMVDGMNASGKNLYVTSLQRNIDARDIKAFNLFIELYFGCSSFGVWGNATADGNTIIARNYDFFYDTQGNIINDQLLIAYAPTGTPKFVSFGWPGWFGVASAINENGVVVMLNVGNSNDSNGNGPFHAAIEVPRDIIDNTTYQNYLTQPLSIVDSASQYTPTILLIGTPYQGSSNPVYYIEDSPDLALIRWAADTDPNYSQIIATNHFIKIMPPPPSTDESVMRYDTIWNGLMNLYATGNHTVASSDARNLLNEVADIVAPTLTSIVVRPNTMDFDVSFATMVNGSVQTATHVQPQTYTFASLFPAQGPIITASAGTGGSISPSGSVSVTSGSNQTFTITPNSGYAVSFVTVDGASIGAASSYTFTNVTTTHTIAASFIPTYTITAAAGTGGSISPSGSVSVTSGSNQTFTITPNSGYVISSITVDGTSAGTASPYIFTNVTSNHTIAASFIPVYTITAGAGSGGSISPSGSVSVPAGSNQTFTITSNSGYVISSILVDGRSVGTVSPYTFTNVNSNHTIAVNFAAGSILTSISVAPSPASVAVSKTQQFSATAKDQSGNALVPQPSFSWTVSGGGTITSSGLFTAGSTAGGPYTVTATSGGVSGTASVTVTASTPITIGETSILGTNDSGNGGLLLAQQTSLGQTATMVSMSFYVTTPAGSLELGIYDSTGPNGGPGTLKANTASFTPVSGWNTVKVASQVTLPAGVYWLAYLPSSNNLGFKVSPTTGTFRFYSYTQKTMPGTFSKSPAGYTGHWSFYATLQP